MYETKFDQPKRAYVAAAFQGAQPGDTITYDDLRAAFPAGDFDPNRDRGAILRHRDIMLREQQRAIVAVPTVGYRVIRAEEHWDLAQTHRLSARRKASKSARVARNFRRGEVSPEGAAKLDRMAERMGELERRLTRQERKTEKLAAQVATVSQTQSKSDADVSARLERLERLLTNAE